MLVVKTLGKFEMSDGDCILNDDVIRSDMLKKLLIYLLMHRDHPSTVMELSEALWEDGEVDNPAGALKNLMYRLRSLLKKVLGDQKYIVTGKGTYTWNNEIDVDFDTEYFEKYYKQGKAATTKEDMIQNYENALLLYRGEFMENAFEQHWAVTLSTYFHSLFLSIVKNLAELYFEEERYQDMEDVSVYALKVSGVDEEVYCMHIMALVKGNKYDLARKRYDEAVKVLESSLGIINSEQLEKVEVELLKMCKGNEAETLEDVYEDIQEESTASGVFWCGYSVFREIYRREVRYNSRIGEQEHIVLFSVDLKDALKSDNAKMEHYLVEQGMKCLKKAIKRVLRIGDVAAQYSDSQFVVLLPRCSYDAGIAVANRVLDKFNEYDKGRKVEIDIEIEPISDVKSAII